MIESKIINCRIRPAEARDYKKMAELAGQLHYPSTTKQIRDRLQSMAFSNQYAVYVAELPTGEIAGWIGLFIFRSVEQDPCAEISGLITDESVRSRGIGKALLEVAAKWARAQGCKAISVHSNVLRGRAHRFYEQNGYGHVKTQKYLVKSLATDNAHVQNA